MREVFRPSLPRLLVAVGAALAGGLLPQEAPLEWFPLDDPGGHLAYLEITCSADQPGEVSISYDTTGGPAGMNTIRWTISPTTHAYSYIYPLPDAPITALTLSPLSHGGTFWVRQLRVIDRRSRELRRFPREGVLPVRQIATVAPATPGWKITSTAAGNDPVARLILTAPLVPVGYQGRNLHRCLLSIGYLALLLAIVLLAVLVSCDRPAQRREWAGRLGFIAILALLFALVGNRGLIRDSIRAARTAPTAGSGSAAVTTAPQP
jgi:hypothetical protein